MPGDEVSGQATASGDATLAIDHDSAAGRFTTTVDGHQGHVKYERDGDVLVITHTVVPPQIGGRGIAGKLVRAAFEHARDQGWKVRTVCSYAAAWVLRHPEFSTLMA